ncbi:MAG: AAA family ATPase [Chloroflexi bacterium]|nr:AAA family ATPase [Chloroflexota bacterium]
MRDNDVNLYRGARLFAEFGPFVGEPGPDGTAVTENDILGEFYRRVLAETTAIVAHQWRNEIARSALKGFLFCGGVGIGKTTMARRLAYELVRIFGASNGSSTGTPPNRASASLPDSAHAHSALVVAGPDHTHGDAHGEPHEHPPATLGWDVAGDDTVLVIVDGADIARGRYGDSEEQLRKLFQFAREGEFHGHRHEDDPVRRTVLLFDDVESLFLARGSGGAKEWHFSQNSVFFHAVDELDTARTAVVLTTNRIDLVDEAIIDRFLPYEFGAPPPEVLREVARHRAARQRLDDARLAPVLAALDDPAGTVKSIRDVERMVTRAYVASIVGHDRAAVSGDR